MIRLSKSTSWYPGYDHTSYNLDIDFGRQKVTLSFHVKTRFKGGGFFFAVRPEFEIRRSSDTHEAFRLSVLETGRKEYICSSCKTSEMGEPGLKTPKGWTYAPYGLTVCSKCSAEKTLDELMSYGL